MDLTAVEEEADYQLRWGRYDDARWIPYLRHLLATAAPVLAGYRRRPLEAMRLSDDELYPIRAMREDAKREAAGIRRRLRELGVDCDGWEPAGDG